MDVFDLFAKITLDTKEYDSKLSNAGSKLSSFGGTLNKALGGAAKIGGAAIAAATGAVAAIGGASVSAGAEFDKSMSQVAATLGKTMSEMESTVGQTTVTLNGQVQEFSGNLRDFAQFMGQNTAFSATQAADALNYMALAGYDAQTSMDMLPNVLNLAAAGNMDLARASDMVTDTQTAFGISLERTSQMVDEMAKAASTGNTSVEQLGDAFLVVGGLAKELNGGMITLSDGTETSVDGLQELEIALTAMANAGVKGSEAGTHMRNMLLKLASPTAEGTKALENMGVKVFDAEGNMRSLSDVFGDLSDKLGEMTQEEKIQTISKLFNTRDMAAAEAMLAAIDSDWDKIGESILDAEGAASQMAATQLDNLAGDVTLFKSALEGAEIAISDVLTPSLREFVQFGTKGLSELTVAFKEGGLSGAVSAFGDILSDGLTIIAGKIPDFVEAGIQLIKALGQGIMDNLDVFIGAGSNIIGQLTTAFSDGLPDLISAGSQIISALLDALIQNLPQITPLIVQFIVGIAQILADNAEKVVDAAITIAGAIGEGLIQAAPIIVDKIPDIIDAIVKGFEEHPEALITIGPFILTKIAGSITSSIGILKKVMPVIGNAFDKVPILNAAKTALSGIGTSIGQFMTADIGTTLAAGGTAAVGTAATAIAGGAAAAFGGLEIGKKMGEWFFPDDAELYEKYSGISGTFELIKDTAVAVGDGLSMEWEREMEVASENYDTIMTAAGEAFVKIEDKAGELRDNLQPVFETAKTNAVNAWNDIRGKFDAKLAEIKGVFEPARAWFETTFKGAKDKAVGAFNDARSKFATKWNEMKAAIPAVAWFDENFRKAKDKVVGAFSDVGSKFKTIWGNIKDAFNLDDALTWGKDLIGNFIGGIKEKAGALKEELKGVADKVKSFLGFSEPEEGPLSDFHTYAPDMMELFAKGIRDNTDVVTDQIKKSFDFGDTIAAENPGMNGGFNAGGITINLYAKDGQSAREVVDEVEYRIAKNVEARKAVWAM